MSKGLYRLIKMTQSRRTNENHELIYYERASLPQSELHWDLLFSIGWVFQHVIYKLCIIDFAVDLI